ncbi:carbonic anhydrase 4-like [Brachionus plicatilis]|uniref:Carbonic anhydrase n=1 Tax=Brachionus plicatilis TaxID=10195 RepID=A0A3M7QFQ3_BRAPC|nr:carbonic anhydrase 4-like [Brachionus plicatilis]
MTFKTFTYLAALSFALASEWDYKGLGPDFWIREFPSCAGKLQSPINIKQTKAVFDPKLNHVNFHNYDWLLYWNVTNSGKTIMVNQIFNESLTPYITGSDFGDKYYLNQFHFHWGFNIFQGSEHLLDYQKFPLEVHLVHINENNEKAVISFLFQISERDNENIQTLVDKASLDFSDSDYHVIKFSLNLLVPRNEILKKEGYFRYIGSLTTPPCSEGVKWTVFRTKINISEAQMEKFYKNEIDFNNREVQELNNRGLFTNVQHDLGKKTNINNFDSFFKILFFKSKSSTSVNLNVYNFTVLLKKGN